MRVILTLCFLSIGIFSYSQSSQILLDKYNLIGMTAEELRIMRNEIFARHGYIFESEDLKDYFANKIWYEPRHSSVDTMLTELDKKNINTILDFEKNNSYKIATHDESITKSSFVTRDGDHKYLRQIEISYPKYVWKKTVERVSFGAEKEPTTVTLEFLSTSPYNSEGHEYWHLVRKVDDMIVHYDYIHATTYGFPEDNNEFYAHFSNKPFLEFTANHYFKVDIPNSSLKDFFIGFSNQGIQDTDEYGKIYLANKEGVINILTIKSRNMKGYLEEGQITLYSNYNNDKFYNEHEFQLWSANKANSKNDLSTFYIKIDGAFREGI